MPCKESPQLGVPPLEHPDDLLVGPVVHRDAPDLRDGHPHAPVPAAALDADQSPVTDGRPFGIPGVAIDAIPVAGKGMQQALAGRRKGLPVGSRVVFVEIAAFEQFREFFVGPFLRHRLFIGLMPCSFARTVALLRRGQLGGVGNFIDDASVSNIS